MIFNFTLITNYETESVFIMVYNYNQYSMRIALYTILFYYWLYNNNIILYTSGRNFIIFWYGSKSRGLKVRIYEMAIRLICSSDEFSLKIKKRKRRYLLKYFYRSEELMAEDNYVNIKVALAHPAASNGVCSRHRSKLRKRKQ